MNTAKDIIVEDAKSGVNRHPILRRQSAFIVAVFSAVHQMLTGGADN
jgi:hypothetical protein